MINYETQQEQINNQALEFLWSFIENMYLDNLIVIGEGETDNNIEIILDTNYQPIELAVALKQFLKDLIIQQKLDYKFDVVIIQEAKVCGAIVVDLEQYYGTVVGFSNEIIPMEPGSFDYDDVSYSYCGFIQTVPLEPLN